MISNYIYKVTPDNKINDLIQDLKSGDPKLEPNTIIGTQIPNETTTGEHQLVNLTYEYLLNNDESLFDKIMSVYDQIFLYDYVFDKEDPRNKNIYRLLLAVSLKLDLLNSKDFKEFTKKVGKLSGGDSDRHYYGIRNSSEAFSILTRTSSVVDTETRGYVSDFSKEIAITSKFFYSLGEVDDHRTIDLAKVICDSDIRQYAECKLFSILYDRSRNYHGRYEGPLTVLEEVVLSEILRIPDSLTEGYYDVPRQVMMYLALRVTRDQELTDLGVRNMSDLWSKISSLRNYVEDLSRELPNEVRDSMDLLE